MSEAIQTELVKAVPAALWVGFAVLVFMSLRRALIPQLNRLSSVKTAMVELSFAEQLLDEASAQPGNEGSAAAPSASERRAAVSRLEHAVDIMRDGRILWVDDNPEWNRPLINLFAQLGMTVDTVRSTEEAVLRLRSHSYDIVLTDMRRDNEQPAATAGVTLVEQIEREGSRLPVVIFAAAFNPRLGVHPSVFAYTNDANELVHYVIDVMERVKFGTVF